MNDESSWCICGHHLNAHGGYHGMCYADDAIDLTLHCDCTEFDPLWGDEPEPLPEGAR